MVWNEDSLKEAFDYIKSGPKASRFGNALGEVKEESSNSSLERLCPHCYDVLEVDRDYPIWGCLNCTKSFVATENIDDEVRVAIATFSVLGVVLKIALRDGMVADIETKKVSNKIEEYCKDIPKDYYSKLQKLMGSDRYSLEYFSEIMFASFEGKKYRDYRNILYRAVFELISSDGKLYSYEMNILKEMESLMKFDYPIYNYLYKELINSLSEDDVKGLLKLDSKDKIEDKISDVEKLYSDETLESLHFPTILKEMAKKHLQSLNKPLKS